MKDEVKNEGKKLVMNVQNALDNMECTWTVREKSDDQVMVEFDTATDETECVCFKVANGRCFEQVIDEGEDKKLTNDFIADFAGLLNYSANNLIALAPEDIRDVMSGHRTGQFTRRVLAAGDPEGLTKAVESIFKWLEEVRPGNVIVKYTADITLLGAWNCSEKMREKIGDDAEVLFHVELIESGEEGSIAVWAL